MTVEPLLLFAGLFLLVLVMAVSRWEQAALPAPETPALPEPDLPALPAPVGSQTLVIPGKTVENRPGRFRFSSSFSLSIQAGGSNE